jgi:phosphate-selective porin OprO/OprP
VRVIFALPLVLAMSSPAAAQQLQLQAGEWLRLDFRARVQADVRRAASDDKDTDIDIARRRVGVEGRVAKVLAFEVDYELSDREWRDLFVDYRPMKPLQVRAGTFKMPFGLEANTSATNLDFIYRARISSRLAPGRDTGVLLHGKLLKERVEYEAGVFRRDGDNARPANATRVFGGRTTAVRAVLRPFRGSQSPAATLQIGAAVSAANVPLGFSAVRGRTTFGLPFFKSDVWVAGQRIRTGVEMRWRPGRLSLQSEYIRLTDERRGQSVEGLDLSPLLAHGWYVDGVYALTGKRHRLGRIEAAARVEMFAFGSTGGTGVPSSSPRADRVLGNTDRAITFGANWHLYRWFKIQANVIREGLEHSSMSPDPGRRMFWSRVLRVQFAI